MKDKCVTSVPNSHPDNFIFNPTGITNGFYNVALIVTDNGNPSLSTRVELLLEIATTAPILTAIDSDGIPNYLDNNNLTSNGFQILGGDSDNYVMSTEPGLNLHLGDIAFAARSGSVLITEADCSLR